MACHPWVAKCREIGGLSRYQPNSKRQIGWKVIVYVEDLVASKNVRTSQHEQIVCIISSLTPIVWPYSIVAPFLHPLIRHHQDFILSCRSGNKVWALLCACFSFSEAFYERLVHIATSLAINGLGGLLINVSWNTPSPLADLVCNGRMGAHSSGGRLIEVFIWLLWFHHYIRNEIINWLYAWQDLFETFSFNIKLWQGSWVKLNWYI